MISMANKLIDDIKNINLCLELKNTSIYLFLLTDTASYSLTATPEDSQTSAPVLCERVAFIVFPYEL